MTIFFIIMLLFLISFIKITFATRRYSAYILNYDYENAKSYHKFFYEKQNAINYCGIIMSNENWTHAEVYDLKIKKVIWSEVND